MIYKNHKKQGNVFLSDNYTNLTYNAYVKGAISEIALNMNNPIIDNLLIIRKTLFETLNTMKDDMTKLKNEKFAISRNYQKEAEKIIESNGLTKTQKELDTELNDLFKARKELIARFKGNKNAKSDVTAVGEATSLQKKIGEHPFKTIHMVRSQEMTNLKIKITGLSTFILAQQEEVKDNTEEISDIMIEEGLLESEKEFKLNYSSNPNKYLSRNQVVNKLIAIWEATLGQNRGLLDMVRPSGFKHNIEVRDYIDEETSKHVPTHNKKLNPTSGEDQVKIRKRVIDGKIMLNVAANTSSSLGIFEHLKVYLNNGKTRTIRLSYDKAVEIYGEKNVIDLHNGTVAITEEINVKQRYDKSKKAKLIELYGEQNVYDDVDSNYVICKHVNLGWSYDESNENVEGIEIHELLAEDVDQTVDASTVPMIKNINSYTFALQLLQKLVGQSKFTIGLLYNIEGLDIALHHLNTIKRTKKLNLKKGLDAAIDSYLIKYLTEIGKLNSVPKDAIENNRFKSNVIRLKTFKELNIPADNEVLPTEEQLRTLFQQKFIQDSLTANEKLEFYRNNIASLQWLNNLILTQASFLDEFTTVNADKFYGGTTMSKYSTFIEKVNKENKVLYSGDKPFLDVLYKSDKVKHFKNYYEFGIVKPFNTIRTLFGTSSNELYGSIYIPFKKEFGKYNKNYERHEELLQNYINFLLYSQFPMFNKPVEELYTKIGFIANQDGDNNIKSLYDYISKYNPSFHRYFEFVKYGSSKQVYLKAKNISKRTIGEAQKMLLDLYYGGSKDKEFVESLIVYAYVKEGFNFTSNSITQLLSYNLLAEIGLIGNNGTLNQTAIIALSKNNDLTFNYDLLIENFLLNNIHDSSLVPKVNNSYLFKGKNQSNVFYVKKTDLDNSYGNTSTSRFVKYVNYDKTTKTYTTQVYKRFDNPKAPENVMFIDISKSIEHTVLFSNNVIERDMFHNIVPNFTILHNQLQDSTNDAINHCI
jgi:hypothetical protein